MRQGLFAVLLVTACQVSGDPDRGEAAGSVSVEVAVSDLGVVVTRVYPVEQFPITTFQSPTLLRYHLLDRDGARVVSGIVPDTRWVYSEGAQDGVPFRRETRRSHGLVSLRLPAVAGTIVIEELREEGPVELGRVEFDPARQPVDDSVGSSRHALAGSGDVLGAPVTIHGTDDAKVKLLILPEGYTEAELPIFEMRAAEMVQELLATRDYADYKAAFRVQRQNVRSVESGLQGITADDVESAFELETDDSCPAFGGSRTWLGLGPTKAENLARDLGNKASANVTILLVNYEEPLTACAGDRMIILGAGDHPGRTLGHELGHALFDLGDEYDSDTAGAVCGVLSWLGVREKANVTTEGGSPPWWDLVTPGVPLPTPQEQEPRDAVGAFEGAQYCASGYFKPTRRCMMDNTNFYDFCPVCRREMDRFFGALGYNAPPDDPACPKRWRDDGICDTCLGDDPDCGGLRCDVDGACHFDTGEGCGSCPEDCGACRETGCGDGRCAEDETDTCAEDCGCRADYCQAEVAPFGCWCDAACQGRGDCCFDAELCAADPP